METIDEEVTDACARASSTKRHKADKPFFLWCNTTAMHFRTHCGREAQGQERRQGDYNDVMVAHDENIGRMLAKLDELGIADNTIVMYSTDNGPHYNSWPDAGITPFRSREEHQLGRRLARAGLRALARQDQGGHGPQRHRRRTRTGCRRCSPPPGEPDIKEKLLDGHKAGDKTFKVHIDGYNMLPYLTGEAKESPRKSFFYISDDGDILAIRMGDWKVVLMEQRAKHTDVLVRAVREAARARRSSTCGAIRSSGPTRTRTPTGTGSSPTPTSSTRCRRSWRSRSRTSRKFPPRQKPASFNLDEVLRTLEDASGGASH